MSTYAQIIDYQEYTSLPTAASIDGFQALLDKAEKDIDNVIRRTTYLTDTVLGIKLSGVDSGTFKIQQNWRGIVYTSGAISWNAVGQDVVNALQSMQDTDGNFVPMASWQIPDARYYQQKWAFGPFPGSSVVVQARNSMGRQRLDEPIVVASTLAGPHPEVTLQLIVGGGLRVNPYLIPADYADALKNAVCAQAEYRDQMGDEFFVRAQFTRVAGPEFQTRGKLPVIGPRVLQELNGTDLIQRGARARAGTAIGVQTVYVPVGTTPIADDWRAI